MFGSFLSIGGHVWGSLNKSHDSTVPSANSLGRAGPQLKELARSEAQRHAHITWLFTALQQHIEHR